MNDSRTAESIVIEEEVVPFLQISQRLAPQREVLQALIDQISGVIISENPELNQKKILDLATMVEAYLRLSSLDSGHKDATLITEFILKMLGGDRADNTVIREKVEELAAMITGKVGEVSAASTDSHMSEEMKIVE